MDTKRGKLDNGIITAIIIAAIPALTYLYTYFLEAGILHFYGITSRFINLEFHVFAMTWRVIFLYIVLFLLSVLIYYFKRFVIFNENNKIWPYLSLYSALILTFVLQYIAFDRFCFELIFFTYVFIYILIFIVYLNVRDSDISRLISIFLIIYYFTLGISHLCYEYGRYSQKDRDTFDILKTDDGFDRELLVLIENDGYFICVIYDNEPPVVDGSLYIMNAASSSGLSLKKKQIGKLTIKIPKKSLGDIF